MDNEIKNISDLPAFDSLPEIERNPLGKSTIQISTIGLGCRMMHQTSPDHNLDMSLSTIHKALDEGINYIDTSPIFGYGTSEQIIGRVTRERRDEMVIGTKCGLRWSQSGRVQNDCRPETIQRQIDRSRERMNTDVIDLCMVFGPPNTSPKKICDTLAQLHHTGKIRAIGLCNFSRRGINAFLESIPVHAIQSRYNMLERSAEKKLWPFCEQHDIGGLACSTLAQGILTDKTRSEPIFDADDPRRNDPVVDEECIDRNLEIARKIRQKVHEEEMMLPPLVTQWTREQTGITTAIVGARSEEQLEQILPGAGDYASKKLMAIVEHTLEQAHSSPSD